MNFAPIQAVFLDRDGTVIVDRHYLSDPAGVRLLPGVGQALGRLCAAGLKLFLVSNQSGIGRGMFGEGDLAACQARLAELLEPFGARFTGMRYCPHAPEDDCDCRKPRTGMWESLRDAHGLDPRRCVMIGDKREDVLFGLNAGFAASFWVMTGKGREHTGVWDITLPVGQTATALPWPLAACAASDDTADTDATALWLACDVPSAVDEMIMMK